METLKSSTTPDSTQISGIEGGKVIQKLFRTL